MRVRFVAACLSCAHAATLTSGAVAASPATLCIAASSVRGVDVSYYQGQIDWGAVHAAGVGFAIARVSDGLSHLDPEFANNWRGIRDAGLVRGAYQYFEPSDDVAAQADLVVEKVGQLEPGDLPVALDVEATSGLAPAALGDEIEAWLERVAAGTGKPPLIYALSGFWDGSVASDGFGAYPLWIASYTAACPALPEGWTAFRFWQRGTGSVPGIATTVDLDAFDGDLAALLAFAGASADPVSRDGGVASEEPDGAAFDADATAFASGDSGARGRTPRWDIARGPGNAPASGDDSGGSQRIASGDDSGGSPRIATGNDSGAARDGASSDEENAVDAARAEPAEALDAPDRTPSNDELRRASRDATRLDSGCSVGGNSRPQDRGWSTVVALCVLRRRKSPRRRSTSPRAPQNPKKRSGMRSAC